MQNLPSDIRLSHADKIRCRVIRHTSILLLTKKVVLLDSIVRVLVEPRMPKVDSGEAQVDDELSDDQGRNKGSAQGDGDV